MKYLLDQRLGDFLIVKGFINLQNYDIIPL